MTPEKYCQKKAASSGSSFYYSFLFLPDEQRKAITALYAFCREVDDVVDECNEASVAQVKLQWWRDETQRLFQKKPRHPVTQALLVSVEQFNLPEEHFMEIIDGMEMDLLQSTYASFKDLQLYCHRAAGVVGLMAAEIFGYQDRKTLDYAHNLGLAFQLTNIIRDVREDGQRQRLYIPLDELTPYGLSPKDLWTDEPSEQAVSLIRFQVQRAQNFYKKALASLSDDDRYAQRSGLAMAAIYREILEKIHQDPICLFKQRVSISPIRKLWLTWRTIRAAKKTI